MGVKPLHETSEKLVHNFLKKVTLMLPKLKKQYCFLYLLKEEIQTLNCVYFFISAFCFTYHTETTQTNAGALFAHVQCVFKSHQLREALLTAHTNQADTDFKD